MSATNTLTVDATDEPTRSSQSTGGQPFLHLVASNLHRVMPLARAQHLDLWRRILQLYEREQKALPEFLQCLCQERFVEDLLHDEVFWALAGSGAGREDYSRATTHLSAVYATAALLAAARDELPLGDEEQALLASGLRP